MISDTRDEDQRQEKGSGGGEGRRARAEKRNDCSAVGAAADHTRKVEEAGGAAHSKRRPQTKPNYSLQRLGGLVFLDHAGTELPSMRVVSRLFSLAL